MNGSAVASQKLNVVTRQAPSLSLAAEPVFDAKPVVAPPRPQNSQALASFSLAKMALIGMSGWAVVAVIAYGLYQIL